MKICIQKYFFFHLLIVVALYNCQRSPNEQSIMIDVSQIAPHALEELFSTARIIPLETTDSSLIAQIDKIILHEEKIYILDTRQYIVFVFDNSGHFLFKIDQSGRGPEEYNILYDININPYNQQLELLDAMGYLLTFDLTGKFINKQALPKEISAYHKFQRINQEYIIFACKSTEKIINIYSEKEKKIVGMYIEEENRYSIGPSTLYTWHDTVYFSRALFDQIYHIDHKGPHLAFEWFISGYDYDPVKTIPKYDRNNWQEFNKVVNNLPCTYWKNYQNKYYLYSLITLKDKTGYINIFHHKSTGKNILFERLQGSIPFIVDYMDDDVIFNVVSTNDVIDYQEMSILDSISKKILKKYSDMNNPCLIEYKFK